VSGEAGASPESSGAAPSEQGAEPAPVVEVRDLVVRRGRRTVLDVPALAIRRGEILTVIGPNGAGKSTLAGALALLERPAGGTVLLDGRPVDWGRGLLAARRRLAVVFQEPLLLDMTVRDNVGLGLRLRGVGRAERDGRVREWLARLGIAHLADRPARALSGGEAQRASLARALVLDPELLVLDEPFAALDPPTREALAVDLVPILRERGTTTVLVTHDRDEAFGIGDRVAVVVAGRIAQLDAPLAVLAHPATEEIARFVRPRRLLRAPDVPLPDVSS
jgi:ABC-type sugar transport system ATPase subunit